MGNLIIMRREDLKLEFANRNVELQCRSVKAANKLFGGGEQTL